MANLLAKMEEKDYHREVKDLTMAYMITGFTIFVLGGTLGLTMRLSQAGIIRINPELWYRFMTLHGDAMFIGFGVFMAIGLTYYVLVYALDAPLHSFLWAKIVYWLYIIGVTLVVLGTIVFGFAASWVFLYPLPIPERNNVQMWDNTGASVFLIGVIILGVAIILYTIEILLTVQQNGPGILRGLGIDFLRPPDDKEHGTYKWGNKPFPVAVIPLTVNALGMLLATPVFAILLILMLFEVNGFINVFDALMAKNMLWWFGHPVVYQLLFPMAGFFYYIVPKYAKRPLLGQRALAGTWFLATLVQNTVWAHHIYMDFVQPLPITVTMQLTTYAITLPSLGSLFALSATIYSGEWEWDPVSLFAFTGIVGWFLAGIQGVINATIWENTIIHNTLWVVGHFHTMALLNITSGFFALAYYLLPQYTGRPIERKYAIWHWWGHIIGIFGMVHFWLLQGLLAVPRRSAEFTLQKLPESLVSNAWFLTLLSVPFFLVMAAAQLFFFVVFVKNIWGAPEPSATPTKSIS